MHHNLLSPKSEQTGAGLLLYVLIMGVAVTLAFSTYLIILTRSTQQTYANLRAELTYQIGFSHLQDTVLQLLLAQESQINWPPLTQAEYRDQLTAGDTSVERYFHYQDVNNDGQKELVIDIKAENQQIVRQLQGIYQPPGVSQEPLDIMLLLDISQSMDDPDQLGNESKLTRAKQAAQEFVDQFKNYSQARIGLIAYSTTAAIKSQLNLMDINHYLDLQNQIDQLTALESTNIAAAIETNLSPQIWTKFQPDDPPRYLVLLTDGIPTVLNLTDGSTQRCKALQIDQDQLEECLAEAENQTADAGEKAKSTDYQIEIFTIGLGQTGQINQTLLKQLANDTDHYYYSPTSDQLSDIYRRIARQITGYGRLNYYEVIP